MREPRKRKGYRAKVAPVAPIPFNTVSLLSNGADVQLIKDLGNGTVRVRVLSSGVDGAPGARGDVVHIPRASFVRGMD
jgi:hypothetical protein